MSETRFIYNNLWRKGTALTPSSEDPQHPAVDTQMVTKSMYWQASVKTSPVTIPINQGATPGAIDFVAILAHNIESSGVVITLEGDAVSTFDSGAFVTRTISHNPTNIFEFVTTFTKQYVRLKLVKAAGDFTEYPKIATIFCGSYFEPNIDYVKGYAPGREDYSEVELTDDLILFAQEKPVLKKWYLPYWALDDASKDEALALMEECGEHKAFIVVFDKASANTDSHLVRLEDLSDPVFQYFNKWDWEMAIKEVV